VNLRPFFLAIALGAPLLAERSPAVEPGERQELVRHHLDAQGWRKPYDRGAEIRNELASLDPEARKKFGIAKYRGEKVAFAGGSAPPGGTNDLITADGFYLRIVTKSGADLRPHATGWSVIVHGTILQVLPENKVIVVEVEDWLVYLTT
jgi:hypothetical protein